MKQLYLNTLAIAAILILVLPACKKDDLPGGGNGHNCDPVITCREHAKGTMEMCWPDTNYWLINSYSSPNGSPTPGPIKVLAPVNLPQNFRVNMMNVEFDYTYLNDSVFYSCGCFPLPNTYAQKVRICNIKRDTLQLVILKPVIYLYPEKKTRVDVQLLYKGELTTTYPDYDYNKKGWTVDAQPDGSLLNLSDATSHQYLFWEGKPATPYNFDMNSGYCIKGSETKRFLQTILPKLGLTPKEYNDMIVFWLPKMQENKYNLIHFAGSAYTEKAPLQVSPAPDNMIRVFMAFQPSDEYVNTEEPILPSYSRKGFTVVEWGGVELPPKGNLRKEAHSL
ncbi:MAG TPA: hypothetical protein VGF30_02685 [Bacteroidia bacterium]